MSNQETKVCSKEGVEKPLDAFHKDASAKDGLSSSCAKCRNAVKRKGSTRRRPHRSRAKAPVETEKPLEQREQEALTRCHMNAYKNLREMYPLTFKQLLEKELENNPIMIAKKWRQLPETEGV